MSASGGALLLLALSAYVIGFAVVLAWTRALHRRHGVTDRRAALPAALFGGALGALTALLADGNALSSVGN